MKNILVLFLIVIALVGCNNQRFEELQKNPNNPTTAAPINILQGVIIDSWEKPWDDESKYSQYWATGYKIYGHQNYMFGSYAMNYNQLRNVNQTLVEAKRNGSDVLKPFFPIAKYFQAYFFIRMSERLGDVPMSEAMKGATEGNFTPKFDTQKDVYVNALKLLEEANTEIVQYTDKYSLGNDLYYGGDLKKWQKAINTFHLRVLMSLSKRTSEVDVIAQFKAIIENPTKYPIMESNQDNMQIVYPGNTNDRYPVYPDETAQNKQRNAITETYISILRRTQDPRIFRQMEPGDKINVGIAGREKMFSSFIGANSGDDMTVIAMGLNTSQYATIKYSLYVTPKGIPTVQLGYPELQFTIAEAANRGWITENAATHYNLGVEADMKFYDVSTTEIQEFISRNAYIGNTPGGLTQILEQKYVAFFQNSGYQPFFEQRRTGVPTFNVGAGNDNGKIPVRWMYPDNERNYNATNLTEALQRQFGGSDNINDKMWLIK